MSTSEYYEKNGKAYAESTVNANMADSYSHFLPLVRGNGIILDLGCGSGRDSKSFIEKGFKVVAVDGSKQLCKYASSLLNQEVRNIKFDELDYENEFDGVWACASLLHVSKSSMHDILAKISKALKDDGIFYCSFKYGDSEREKDGRSFSDYNENDLKTLFTADLHLDIVEWWLSFDVRKDRSSEKWINIILKKQNER